MYAHIYTDVVCIYTFEVWPVQIPSNNLRGFRFGKMIPILSKATCWYHWENTLAIVPKIFSAHVALYNPCIASGFASSAMGGPWNETHGPSQREGLGSDLCTVSHWEIMRPHTRKGCCMVAKHLDRHALGLLHWLCLHCCIVCKVHDSMVSLMSAVSTKHISWVQTKNSHSKWQRKAQELVVIYIYIYHMYSKYMYIYIITVQVHDMQGGH